MRLFGLQIENLFPPAPSLAPAATPTTEAPKETTMDIATIENDVVGGLKAAAGFFAGVLARIESSPTANPANVAAIKSAAGNVSSAGSSVEAAIPAFAEEAATLVLAMIPGNSPYVALEDAFLEQVIAILQAKKSTAAAN